MSGCCRLPAKVCIARPYGCADGPEVKSGQEDRKGKSRSVGKSTYFASEYGKPEAQGKPATVLIIDDPVSEADGRLAQGISPRDWHAVTHAIAQKAFSNYDRRHVETDRPSGRGNEEVQMSVWSGKVVEFTYENHRGVTEVRRVVPRRIWFGSTEWHPRRQWLLSAWCLERQASRDFAFEHVSGWAEADDQNLPWREASQTSVPQCYAEPMGGIYGVAEKPVELAPAPLDFPQFDKGTDPRDVQIIRGATYYVTDEQKRKYGKEFTRLGIKTIPIENKP